MESGGVKSVANLQPRVLSAMLLSEVFLSGARYTRLKLFDIEDDFFIKMLCVIPTQFIRNTERKKRWKKKISQGVLKSTEILKVSWLFSFRFKSRHSIGRQVELFDIQSISNLNSWVREIRFAFALMWKIRNWEESYWEAIKTNWFFSHNFDWQIMFFSGSDSCQAVFFTVPQWTTS